MVPPLTHHGALFVVTLQPFGSPKRSPKPEPTQDTLGASRRGRNGIVQFSAEDQRVKNVILKLARGHAVFELNEPQCQSPLDMGYWPLPLLSEEQRVRFESSLDTDFLPKVGSRAMQRGIIIGAHGFSWEWVVVEKDRYRYLAAAIAGGIVVRMVLSEYLACEVIWD